MNAVRPESLPFNKAIEFLRQKVNLPTERWTDIMGDMHSRAFVIAGAMTSEIVTDFHDAIQKAVEGELPFNEFQKRFDEIVERRGWTYRGARGWRTRTIYYTNLSTAYTAGREAQMMAPDVRAAFPMARYRTMDDGRVRPLHRQWNNTVLPWDDPWWSDHTPPLGWGCRCWREPADMPATARPDDGYYQWKNPSTGRTETIPNGVDPGWNYDKAHSAWGEVVGGRTVDDNAVGEWTPIDPRSWRDYGRPEEIPADTSPVPLGPRARTPSEIPALLQKVLGGEARIFTDPTGTHVNVPIRLAQKQVYKAAGDRREQLFPLIGDIIEHPFEIWAAFFRNSATRKVRLRRRYVKMFDIGEGVPVLAIAETCDGHTDAFTVYRKDVRGLQKQREGRLIWGRKSQTG